MEGKVYRKKQIGTVRIYDTFFSYTNKNTHIFRYRGFTRTSRYLIIIGCMLDDAIWYLVEEEEKTKTLFWISHLK